MFSYSLVAGWFGLTRRANVILLGLNLIGAVLYVWRSSMGWVISEYTESHAITAEPFIWAAAIAPVVAAALLIDVPWGVVILVRRQWSSGRLWLLVATVWLIAIAIDFAHH